MCKGLPTNEKALSLSSQLKFFNSSSGVKGALAPIRVIKDLKKCCPDFLLESKVTITFEC